MDTASLLANERRARLAAERLLDMRQRELKSVNRKLAEHARQLAVQVMAKREEVDAIQVQTESLRDEYVQTRDDLARANSAAELAQGRLWSALQSVRDGFAVFDGDQRLVVANKAYLTVFDGLECIQAGISYDDIVQILVEEGIVDTQGQPEAWANMMRTRWQSDPIPSTILRLWNGQFVKLMDRRTPEGGTVTLGVNQTDQLRMWAAVEAIPDGFVLFDQEDRLIMCNAQYRAIYDLPEVDLPYGTSFESILRYSLARGQIAEGVGREEQWLEDRLMKHRQVDGVIEQKLTDGRWLRVLEQATPDGGRVGLRVDITEIKQQQVALEAERERAEAANRAKSAFLANMSHEIRTPMNGVVGMAELLKAGDLSAEQSLYVDTIRTSGQALLNVLNDILDFSKIEANRLELKIAPFNLEDCLHEVVVLHRPTMHGRRIEIAIEFDPKQPLIVTGDADRMRQIVGNLVGNALKFTETGKVTLSVHPGDDGGLRVTVRDTGIGIPQEKLEHIFGEFNQVEDDRNRRYDGTGLGLAICRQLTQQMGGAITVESTLGKGSCFTVVLPWHPADDQTAAGVLQSGWRGALVVGPPSAGRDGVLAHLDAIGLTHTTSTAMPPTFGAADLVFVVAGGDDHSLPDLDGSNVRAVILIGDLSPDHAREGAGYDGYLSVPVSRRTLVDTLNSLVDVKAKQPKDSTAPTRLSVLAAEDNKTNQLVLGKMLKAADITLNIVNNGAEAVAAFETDRPDLIFMDISMPGMDGREAARRIRAFEAEHNLAHTPIVAMTAHAMDSDKAEIADAGIDHHLTKPLNRAALLRHIETVRTTRQVDT